MPYKAVIFDMDGLMCGYRDPPLHGLEAPLKEFGAEIDESYYSRLVGASTAENAIMVKKDFGIKITPEELVKRRRAHYLEIIKG